MAAGLAVPRADGAQIWLFVYLPKHYAVWPSVGLTPGEGGVARVSDQLHAVGRYLRSTALLALQLLAPDSRAPSPRPPLDFLLKHPDTYLPCTAHGTRLKARHKAQGTSTHRLPLAPTHLLRPIPGLVHDRLGRCWRCANAFDIVQTPLDCP
jgi:hypothetical protein